MNAQTLTFDGIAEQFPPDKYILLMPQVSRTLLHIVPMWSLDVATVKVDPNDKKQAYPIQGDDYGLTKTSIDRIATAADLSVMARRIDDRTNRLRAEFEAVAMMETPSGGARGQARSVEWDGELARQKVHNQAVANVQKYGGNNLTESQFNSRVDIKFQKDWLTEREFGARKAESKAGNRAVRALLGLNTSYYKGELRDKLFAIVRFVFTPDLSDPDIKMLVIGETLKARSMLYPSAAPALPAPVAQLTEAPADAEVIQDGPPEEVRQMIAEIEDVLNDWPGNEKMKGQTQARLDTALGSHDADTIEKILGYCRDMRLAAEGGS